MWKFEGACIFVAFHYMVSGITTVGPTVHRRCFEPAEPRLYRGEIPSQVFFFSNDHGFGRKRWHPVYLPCPEQYGCVPQNKYLAARKASIMSST